LINDPYTALKAILQSNTTITDLLDNYAGTSIPLIAYGTLGEVEQGLSALVIYPNTSDPEYFLNDDVFTCDCFAAKTYDSFQLAKTIVKELNQCDSGINGYQARTTARILTSIPDPSAKETNTPVEIRIVNIFN
jgi:hypothetical protein